MAPARKLGDHHQTAPNPRLAIREMLNLAGSVLFGIIGSFVPILYSALFGFIFFISGEGFAAVCVSIMIVWIIFILFMAYMLYNKTVLGIDRGEYESAKTWMLAGAILGFIFAGGIITLILFLIGYVTIDKDIVDTMHYQMSHNLSGIVSG